MAMFSLSVGGDANSPPDMQAARRFAFIAAALKLIGTSLIIANIVINTTSAGIDYGCTVNCDDNEAFFNSLDSCCIRQMMEERYRYEWIGFVFDIVQALCQLSIVPAILALADVWGRRASLTKGMVTAFVISAGINTMEMLYRAGSATTTSWVSNWPFLTSTTVNNAAALQALFIGSVLASGDGLWLFAMDSFLMAVGLLITARLVFKYGELPRGFGYLSAVAGTLGIINFGLELGRNGSWRIMSTVSGISVAVLGFVVYPGWLIYLGYSLASYEQPSSRQGLAAYADNAHMDDSHVGLPAVVGKPVSGMSDVNLEDHGNSAL